VPLQVNTNSVGYFWTRPNVQTALSLKPCAAHSDPQMPLAEQVRRWRRLSGFDASDGNGWPPEVDFKTNPNAVTRRYTKLLIALGLWPSAEGIVAGEKQAAKGKRIRDAASKLGTRIVEPPEVVAIVDDLLAACWEKAMEEDLHVRKPVWANGVDEQFRKSCAIAGMRGSPEYVYLMFALAARRISQTQSWTKINERERHEAAAQEDEALRKLQKVDPDGRAREWLKHYEERRFASSGATSAFRVTKRMIGECDAVLKAWEGTATSEERDAKTALVQERTEKFGDASLYADLASESGAEAIWRSSDGAEILKEWVRFRGAQYNQERLKVPRFCHPNPFLHPTWCEFGGATTKGDDTNKPSKPQVWYAWRDDIPPKPEPGGNADGLRRLWVLLPNFDSKEAKPGPMRWRSKQLSKDLGGLRDTVAKQIPRADRLSVAAAGLPHCDAAHRPIRYRPEFPFSSDAKGWNARLQADRDALRNLEKQWDADHDCWRDEGKALRAMRWFVTFSPKLAASEGPGRAVDPKLGWRSSPHTDLNKRQNREGRAKLILPRLAGLRVLSVDLGLRHAAACAVWQTIANKEFEEECEKARTCGAEIRFGPRSVAGEAPDPENALYCHLVWAEKESNSATPTAKAGHREKFHPVTVYRRVGPDKLGGKDHPAPWARLEHQRQFVIKLQGEGRPAREASNEEIWLVHQLEKEMGLAAPLIDRLAQAGWGKTRKQPHRVHALRKLGWCPSTNSELALANPERANARRPPDLQVDALMSATVQVARQALRRHNDRARIAFGLRSDYKPMPGDKKYLFSPRAGDYDGFPDKPEQRLARHTEYLQDMLCLWYELAVSPKWRDDDALSWWNGEILPLVRKAAFTEPPALASADQKDSAKRQRHEAKISRWRNAWDRVLTQELSRPAEEAEDQRDARQRKADREAMHGLLRPVAEALRRDPPLRERLAAKWADRWTRDEGRRRWNDPDPAKSDFHPVPRTDCRGKRASTMAARLDGGGWHARLRKLANWLVPRGLRTRFEETADERITRTGKVGAARNAGGLSLTRIDALVEFRRALVALRTGGTPWGRVEIGADGSVTAGPREAGESYARRLLDVIAQLREQRSKQLASRIIEAALGVGREHLMPTRKRPDKKCWCGEVHHNKKTPKRPGDRQYDACHAIIIERLDNYKPDEVRTRRENRMLAAWRKAELKKRLREGCELHGLHLRDVPAGYTSRQDSRTGAPGIRCEDLAVDEFLRDPSGEPSWIVRQAVARMLDEKASESGSDPFDERFERASKEAALGKGKSLDRYVVKLYGFWRNRPHSAQKTVRLPRRGGALFVSAGSDYPAATGKGLQADINAAANIGLKAIMDPDWPGAWWYVPAALDAAGWRVPAARTCAGAAWVKEWKVAKHGDGYSPAGQPPKPADPGAAPGATAKEKKVVNLWRDCISSDVPHFASGDAWREYAAYKADVECRVVRLLLEQAPAAEELRNGL
jgi:hypothetical protein